MEIAPDDYLHLITSSTSDWMLGVVIHGDLNELTIYAAPRAMLADPTTCTWTSIADVDDAITSYALVGDTIYLKTHKDAPRYKIIATSLEHSDLAHATVIVPESEVVIEDIRIAGDFSEVEAHEVLVPAYDGTLIPLSIIHKKELRLDGKNPAILRGYGSYGITIHPLFAPGMLAWYERGGIMALAHIRGGGEYGKQWHLAGQKLNKQNTIDDFIACAQYLIEHRYTCPERLAGEGASAGGIPTGGALVQRPDLWAAMVMHVPVVNALRFEFTENGPSNIPEFGSVATEEGLRGLQIMDAYSKVKHGMSPLTFLSQQ